MPAPNFILFITDQHRADFLGCYGHPIVRTPNIDSIAARGTMFDRFYVASPVCMPNCSSLMTGRMPSVHGVRCNGIPLSRDAVTFVDLLREAGYATALVGKSHLQPFTGMPPTQKRRDPLAGYHAPSAALQDAIRTDLASAAYRQEEPQYWGSDPAARVATPFYGFDHVELVAGHGDLVGGDYRRWLLARDPNALSLLGPEHGLSHDYACPQAVRTAIPAELYHTAYIGERARDFLRTMDQQGGDTPFFLMVSFPDPHHPFNPPGKYWDMYSPDDFAVPEAYRRNDWMPPPPVQAAIDQRQSGAANLTGTNTINVSAREAQEARALTAGMITCVDDAVGQVLQALSGSRRRDDTVVMFTSDHGDHLGDHRLLLKGAEPYESITHVPFIWSDPHAARPSRTSALGATLDIPATILDRARVAPFTGMQGRSLLPVIDQSAPQIRDAVFIQYDHQHPDKVSGLPPRIHTLVDARWRLSIFQHADAGELYDLQGDLGEFDNLWDSPEHRAIRAQLTERLLRAEIEHVDRVPMPTRRA